MFSVNIIKQQNVLYQNKYNKRKVSTSLSRRNLISCKPFHQDDFMIQREDLLQALCLKPKGNSLLLSKCTKATSARWSIDPKGRIRNKKVNKCIRKAGKHLSLSKCSNSKYLSWILGSDGTIRLGINAISTIKAKKNKVILSYLKGKPQINYVWNVVTVQQESIIPPPSSMSSSLPTVSPSTAHSPTSTITCDDDQLLVKVKIVTDEYADSDNTRWNITRLSDGNEVMAGGYFSKNEKVKPTIACLENASYEFAIYDDFGDGICSSDTSCGSYKVLVNHDIIISGKGDDFKYKFSKIITPIVNVFSIPPSTAHLPTSTITCDDDQLLVKVKIVTDEYADSDNTRWNITRLSDGNEVMAGGYFSKNEKVKPTIACLENASYEFAIYDDFGDGICSSDTSCGSYKVLVNHDIIISGKGDDFKYKFSKIITPSVKSTILPTMTPIRSPVQFFSSQTPTQQQSDFPSTKSTLIPSVKSSILPTMTPVRSTVQNFPSQTPTHQQSDFPSIRNTITPSVKSTIVPTMTPTRSPVQNFPSQTPTQQQSDFPTIRNTITPSVKSTIVPTMTPTRSLVQNFPSLTPTQQQSDFPSSGNTITTSVKSTNVPTMTPTKSLVQTFPSLTPTQQQSDFPSSGNTITPSVELTNISILNRTNHPKTNISTHDSFSISPSTQKDKINSPVLTEEMSSLFNIELINMGSNKNFDDLFMRAKLKWETIIVADLSNHSAVITIPGFDWFDNTWQTPVNKSIDDVLIGYEISSIDGLEGKLGYAGPKYARFGEQNEDGSYKTVTSLSGIMKFDIDDFNIMSYEDIELVILHEMGHVLGVGTFWKNYKCGMECENGNRVYSCTNAVEEYKKLMNTSAILLLQNETCSHWSESAFASPDSSELMTPYFEAYKYQPITKVSLGALKDLGYSVNMDAADLWSLQQNSSSRSLFDVLMPTTTFTLDENKIIHTSMFGPDNTP